VPALAPALVLPLLLAMRLPAEAEAEMPARFELLARFFDAVPSLELGRSLASAAAGCEDEAEAPMPCCCALPAASGGAGNE
jgi:hypothetical protein